MELVVHILEKSSMRGSCKRLMEPNRALVQSRKVQLFSCMEAMHSSQGLQVGA